MFNIFIRRPILSLVISLIIVLLGVLALNRLPVTQFPDIVPPSVTVTANYTGANAEVCANAVAIPLERAINGVPGMTYMSTVTSNNGLTNIEVFFKVGTDPDVAAVNVQNRITTILDELPEEVIKAGVTTEKEVNSMLMYLNIMSTDSSLDEKFIYNFADINVLKELKRIDGVGFVEIMGAQDYSMRVWLKPDRMHAYDLSVDEIVEAIRSQNVEAAPGKTGESSGKEAQSLQYVIKYTGKLFKPEQYENIVLRADNSGSYLRLKDVADVEFGSLNYSMSSKTDGRPSASIMVKQRPGSNAREIIDNIKTRMEELKESNFPSGMYYNISYDVSRFLDASIHEVLKTLVEAFILVFIIVFLFLQDLRSTIIPALAVPVALIGTLFFMQLFGFSLNLMTLFALVLSIGIVVDNAIVVVEAVHAKMANEKLPAYEATVSSMGEISGAIIAITLVMSAVFVPVAFMEGPVGIFYKQFSITLAIAIVISGINAVTLTPALCAIILKPHDPHHAPKGLLARFFAGFNARYDKLVGRYTKVLTAITGRRLLIVGSLILFVIATWGINSILPSGFIPPEDQGMIYVNVTTPAGATVERTEEVLNKVEKIATATKGVESISTLAGYNLMNDIAGASYGMIMINLKPWDEREHVNEIIARLTEQSKSIKDASIQFFAPPTVPGFGNAGGFEVRLLNKAGDNIAATAEQTNKFIQELGKSKELTNVVTSFNPYFPQYMLHVDQEVAAKMGVSVENALSTLKTLLGSYYASNFIRFGQMYKVMLQAAPEYRTKPEDLLNLYVRNNKNEMVPYSAFVRMERVYGPEQLTRYNMFLSAMINGDAAKGYSSGDVIKTVEQKAKDMLPRGYTIEWSGMTREEVLSGNQAIYIFIICLVFVYLLLAAQYESFMLPLSVILSLPTGIFGSYLLLKVTGLENNIYAQVALVMLIGLLGKNAILIVEYAVLMRKKGYSIFESAVEGAVLRLRPILMTSLAFIAGLIPLCFAHGAGAAGNQSIGVAAAGGMLTGTIFGVLLIPGLYVLFATIDEKLRTKKTPKHANGPDSKLLPVNGHHKVMTVALIMLTTFATGCHSLKPKADKPGRQLPATYTHGADSTNVATVDWQTFFGNKYLAQLVDTALHNNWDLLIAMQRIEAAQANVLLNRGAMLPTVRAVTSAGINRYGDYTMDGAGNMTTPIYDGRIVPEHLQNYTIGLQSTWEADLWGKLKNRKRAALARFAATVEGRHLVVTNLVADVAQLYYELLALDAQLAMLDETITLQQKAADMVKVQKEAAMANELAVQQIEAQLMGFKSMQLETTLQLRETENRLNLLLGRAPQPIARDKQGLLGTTPAVVSAGIPTDLLANRPDIRQAEAELAATRADVRAARAAFYPSLSITAGGGFEAFKTALLFNTPQSIAYNLAAALAAPLINRSALTADLRRSTAGQQEALLNYQRSITRAYTEVYTEMQRIEALQQVYALRTDQVSTLTRSIETSSDLFRSGRSSYLEVLVAQQNALQSKLERITARKRQFQATVNIYRALGGGWR